MLLRVNLHHSAQLFIKFLLGEHFEARHLSDWVKRAEVNELVRLCDCQLLELLRKVLEWSSLGLEHGSATNCLVDVALP